jgi:hypothetical protein
MTLLIDAEPSVAHYGAARLWDDTPPAPAIEDAGRTLDDLLSETWEALNATATTACPVCGEALAPRWSAGAGVVGGRCGNCGSEVS